MKTLVVNFFGGPGTGKSTLSANIFAKLKMDGVDVEIAPEYVKEVVWEESYKKMSNQIYIFGKQHNRIFRLMSKVEVIITDSPLLNSIVYYQGNNPYFKDLILHEYNNMNNISFYLDRNFDYVQNGRVQSLDEAKLIDLTYKNLLDDNNIEYSTITSPYDIDNIVYDIKRKINSL